MATEITTCTTCGKTFTSEKSLRGHCNKMGHAFPSKSTDEPEAPTLDQKSEPSLEDRMDADIRAAEEEVAKTPKAVRFCLCGCGQTTKSSFAMGHDGRVKGVIIRNLKAGKEWREGLSDGAAGYAICKWQDKLGFKPL